MSLCYTVFWCRVGRDILPKVTLIWHLSGRSYILGEVF